MKKILALTLALLLVLSTTACGADKESEVAPEIHECTDENLDYICDSCGASLASEDDVIDETVDETIEEADVATTVPETPNVSIVTNSDNAVLTIAPVQYAIGYEIFVNGACIADVSDPSYTISSGYINVGVNEVYVRAHNEFGYSENSNVVTTGKLSAPMYHSTGTGVEFLNGDVENAEGYIIYGDDGEVLTTIGLGESFDFSELYTEEGFYFPQIQAYGKGWISSEMCGIPVSIGGNGGPIGYVED